MALKKNLPLLILLFSCLLFTLPLWLNLNGFGMGDWDFFSFFNLAPGKTLLYYHQFPHWNPWAGGGKPLFANPQEGFLRPTYFLVLLFGVIQGLKVELILMAFLGVGGMVLLGRHFSLNPWAILLGSSIFCFSSFFSLHFSEGHVHFASYYLFPWLFLFYLRSLEKRFPNIFLGSLLLVWMLFAGAIGHVLIPTVFFMGAHSLLTSLEKKNTRPLQNLLVMGLLSLALGAVKLLPVYDAIKDHPRPTSDREYLPAEGLYYVYLSRDQMAYRHLHLFENQVQFFHEYGAYTGILPLVLFFVGALYLFKSYFPLILSGSLCFLIALGNFLPLSPWRILHFFPVYSSTQVPFRYVVFFIFSLSLVVSLITHQFLEKYKNKKGPYLAALLVILVVVVDLLFVNTATLYKAFPGKFSEIHQDRPFSQFLDRDKNRTGAYSSSFLNCLENQGTLNDYDPVPHQCFARSVDERSYRGEAYLLSGEEARYTLWSPNRLKIQINPSRATLLVINQNYNKGWRLEGPGRFANYQGYLFSLQIGETKALNQQKISKALPREFKKHKIVLSPKAKVEVVKAYEEWKITDHGDKWTIKNENQALNVYHRGLLAVEVPSGARTITLFYRPLSFLLGLLISFGTLVVVLAVVGYRFRRGARKAKGNL